jgi:hypothetical protein
LFSVSSTAETIGRRENLKEETKKRKEDLYKHENENIMNFRLGCRPNFESGPPPIKYDELAMCIIKKKFIDFFDIQKK